jgi:hypothetical protein
MVLAFTRLPPLGLSCSKEIDNALPEQNTIEALCNPNFAGRSLCLSRNSMKPSSLAGGLFSNVPPPLQ